MSETPVARSAYCFSMTVPNPAQDGSVAVHHGFDVSEKTLAGNWSIDNATDRPSGIYMIRLQRGSQTATTGMMLVK